MLVKLLKNMKSIPSIVISVVVVAVVAGFFIIGSPLEQRTRRFDERRINDLQTIQWELIWYWQKKNELPTSLAMLRDDIRGFSAPQDPETMMEYEYVVTGANSFSICAVFSLEDASMNDNAMLPPGNNWAHGTGRTCFKRTIDRDLHVIK